MIYFSYTLNEITIINIPLNNNFNIHKVAFMTLVRLKYFALRFS